MDKEKHVDHPEIVGREGLASTVAAVAGQVSSLEKVMTAEFSALKAAMKLSFENAKLDLQRVESAEIERQKHHDQVHVLERRALDKAQEVNEARLENQNEWRDESKDRMLTYPTNAEIGETTKHIESLIQRNTADLQKFMEAVDTRFKPMERFVTSFQAQLSTIRALVILVPIVLAVAAFIIARAGG